MMITIKRITSLFACMAIIAIFGVGCSGRVEEAGPTTQVETAGIITFTEKDAQKGILRGTYEYEGYTIKFEAVRGEKNPLFSKLSYADSPEYAVDARFCDTQGFCFANAAGGHALANSDWIKEDKKTIPDDERLTKNAITLWAFHEDLKQLPQSEKAGLLEEFDVLRILSDAPRYDTSQFKQSRSEGTPAKGVLAITAATGPYTHIFELWWGTAAWIAEHSSTKSLTLNSGGYIINSMITYNHGSAPGGNGMSRQCSKAYFNRPLALPVKVDCNQPHTLGAAHYGGQGCCFTVYGLTPGTHVCNDDSRLQRDMMSTNGVVAGPYCNDATLAAWSPPTC